MTRPMLRTLSRCTLTAGILAAALATAAPASARPVPITCWNSPTSSTLPQAPGASLTQAAAWGYCVPSTGSN